METLCGKGKIKLVLRFFASNAGINFLQPHLSDIYKFKLPMELTI